jgi:hypothetical protein
MEKIFNYKYFENLGLMECVGFFENLSIYAKKNLFNKCIGLMKLYNIKENNPSILVENFEIFRQYPYDNWVGHAFLIDVFCLNCTFCLYSKNINKFFCHYDPKCIETKVNNFCSKFEKDFNFIEYMGSIYSRIFQDSRKSIFNSLMDEYYVYFTHHTLKSIRLNLGRGDCSGLRAGCLKLKLYKKCKSPCLYFIKNLSKFSVLIVENFYICKSLFLKHKKSSYKEKFKNNPKEIFLVIPNKSEFDDEE